MDTQSDAADDQRSGKVIDSPSNSNLLARCDVANDQSLPRALSDDTVLDPVMLFAKELRGCEWRPTIMFKTKEWCHSSEDLIVPSERTEQIENNVDLIALSMQVSTHAIPYCYLETLSYPEKAVFRFQTYNGIVDKERLTDDIKKAAFVGGTTLTNYSCHERDSKLWYVLL